MGWIDDLKDKVGQAVLGAFSGLTPDLQGIHTDAVGYSRAGWQALHTTAVATSGAGTVLIPGFHLLALVADVGIIVNRMAVCAYGIGAICAKERGAGFILEEEDIPIILARWSGDTSVSDAAISKAAATGAAAFGGKPIAKLLAKISVKHAGILVGKKLGGKTGAKVASKFAAKYAGKATAGFWPLVGPGICAGINVWFITEMSTAAFEWYTLKLNLGHSGAGGTVAGG